MKLNENIGCISFVSILIVITIVSYAYYFSSRKEKPKQKEIVSKYLYIDKNGILHNTSSCVNIILSEDKDLVFGGVKRIDRNNIPDSLLDNCCTYCISDSVFETLKPNNKP